MTEKRVYFMRPVGSEGPIKIGCSIYPEHRLKALTLWSPTPLELIASAVGDHCHENALHYLFREHRVHGEWFHATADLLVLVNDVRRTGKLPPIDVPAYRDRPGALPKGSPLSRKKAALTASVTRAERHAFGYWAKERRPDRIANLIASYRSPALPYPGQEVIGELDRYRSELLAMPKKPRDYEAWQAWRAHRERALVPSPIETTAHSRPTDTQSARTV